MRTLIAPFSGLMLYVAIWLFVYAIRLAELTDPGQFPRDMQVVLWAGALACIGITQLLVAAVIVLAPKKEKGNK